VIVWIVAALSGCVAVDMNSVYGRRNSMHRGVAVSLTPQVLGGLLVAGSVRRICVVIDIGQTQSPEVFVSF